MLNEELMATYLVTGVAGFIASKAADLLLASGHTVVGIDNLNDAYDVRLKEWRLSQLNNRSNFTFQQIDILERAALADMFKAHSSAHRPPFEAVINLAARAGVRPSVE